LPLRLISQQYARDSDRGHLEPRANESGRTDSTTRSTPEWERSLDGGHGGHRLPEASGPSTVAHPPSLPWEHDRRLRYYNLFPARAGEHDSPSRCSARALPLAGRKSQPRSPVRLVLVERAEPGPISAFSA